SLFVAGIDTVGNWLIAQRNRRPAKNPNIRFAVEVEPHIDRRRRTTRNKSPRLAPWTPHALAVLGPHVPIIFAAWIQLTRRFEMVASRTSVAGTRNQFGKAHRQRPLHIGPRR